jgi:hypothetical protein
MSSRTRAVSESISPAISTAIFDVDGVSGRPRLAGENPAVATLSALNLSFWSTIGKPTARVGLVPLPQSGPSESAPTDRRSRRNRRRFRPSRDDDTGAERAALLRRLLDR